VEYAADEVRHAHDERAEKEADGTVRRGEQEQDYCGDD